MVVTDAKGLGAAIKRGDNKIEIEGDFSKKVIRINATGNVAWVVAIGAIGVGVAMVIAAPATGGISAFAGFVSAPAAVATLGAGGASAAYAIAIAAGGVGALTKLRKYKIEKISSNKILLHK